MARNEERRTRLADAGLAVLAQEGARGLTHRAVDRQAGVPVGTASNYFRDRSELISGLVQRLFDRLTPDGDVSARLGAQPPSRDLLRDFLREITSAMVRAPELTLALFELRLEAARRPEVADPLGTWLRDRHDGDVAAHRAAGLPGTPADVALLHYAIDGLLLDRLTTSVDPGTPVDDVVDRLVDRLVPRA